MITTLRTGFKKKATPLPQTKDGEPQIKEEQVIELLEEMISGTNHGHYLGNQQINLFASWQMAFAERQLGARFM